MQEWLKAATLGTHRPALFAAAPAWIDTAREIHLVAKAIEEITPAMALAQLQTGKRIEITPKGSDAGLGVSLRPELRALRLHRAPAATGGTLSTDEFGLRLWDRPDHKDILPDAGEKAELTVSSFTREMLRKTQASSILHS